MQIQVNTDKSIDHTAALDDHVTEVVQAAIGRFGEQIGRVEVHLSDNVAQKSADGDNRCMMEARVNGYQPVVVTDHAESLHQAINRAADKLKRALDSALGKLHDKQKAVPVADLVAPSEEE
ncbi:HPF/RaiA family ribosome-associated protein [Pseudoduganella armeniaca]|uniref:Ribosomal subunit interface protein n=1 Tax=Pseudoduganella armeniaca TaxID=2072590 RepID=A0A2R4C850_9BURK|nr:HPF/RaiA family ribosome-associated protein [Pseudoduganella armeniaca]AVR95799.1 ribosomal subunit interface protein [Pseudoduganella armeniaca]